MYHSFYFVLEVELQKSSSFNIIFFGVNHSIFFFTKVKMNLTQLTCFSKNSWSTMQH